MLVAILTILILIIALFFIAALFVEKNYILSRDIIIGKPVSEVSNYIKYLKNQEKYSKWVMADPEMRKDFKGTDGTIGFVHGWNGNSKACEGEQEITGLTKNKKVDIGIRFIRPFKSIAKMPFLTGAISDGQTRVTWSMSGRQNYPLNLLSALMSGALKKDMDISLNNLKTFPETK